MAVIFLFELVLFAVDAKNITGKVTA